MKITYFISKNTDRLIHISGREKNFQTCFLLFDKSAYKLKPNNFEALIKTQFEL